MKTLKPILLIALFGFLITTSYAQPFLTNGLVAYYPLNGNANDQSGNGRNGTVSNATLTTDRFGNANSAYEFSVSTIICTNLPINLSGSYTYSAWIKLKAFQEGRAIFELSEGTTCNGNPIMYQTASSVFYAPCGNGQTGLNLFGTQANLTNQWRHFVATVGGGVTKIYKDGILLFSGVESWPTTASIMLTLGGARGGYGDQFSSCVLDDVRLYNRALPTNEVAQLYAIEAPPVSSTSSNEAIYVANYGNGLVRGYTGAGADLGPITTTAVPEAQGIAIDASNNFYVVSAVNNNIRRFSPAGVDLGLFATTGLNSGRTLVFDKSGNLYCANAGNNTVRRFSPTGVDLGNFVSNGLSNPGGLAFDEAGNLYVANYYLNQVKKFSTNGTYLGVAISAGLNQPIGVVVIPQAQGGGFYVANDFASTVIRYDAAGNIVSTLTSGTLGRLHYMARDSAGNIYVTRIEGNAVRKFSPTGTDLGNFAVAGLNMPAGIVIGRSALSPCENTVAVLQSQLAVANATNALLQAQLAAVNSSNAVLQVQIALLRAANSNQQTQLIIASNTIAVLQSNLSTANGIISTLQARIASLEAANATLQAQLATANSLNEQLQLQVNSIAQSITRLEDFLAEESADPSFQVYGGTLELQISNLVTAIESMNHGHLLKLKRALSDQNEAVRGF